MSEPINLPVEPNLQLKIIARARSPFREKFAAPRQPGLVPAAEGFIELLPPYNRKEALKDIEQYSHIWLLFLFDQVPADKPWQPTVRPPRLGGNRRSGVFATRSPFRPNRIGMSVIKLCGVEQREGKLGLVVTGLDLIDRTPIIDIKPYLPYVDQVENASAGAFAKAPAAERRVRFSAPAREALAGRQELETLINQTLALDPRPGYRHGEGTGEFGMNLSGCNIRWREEEDGPLVINIEDDHEK
ncbi:tRNA (N6-threonylcarbamoyladenosine(37)-N6)-methyltransferase TrmO [Geothermobacter hydrogeniphilus]|uniref:tRNA (N6-threonylcarbamoyladenosine(37)-N6)-methyltransferase TrmO n=1 Tax=Geothermobacter hydrogeniphilus TaxID=1969733 RepID=A0A1X0Y807_9BACT|nr:tRNA (N6-threonylcarbamoyladenosine(37)-N6)-methyltransferase TrmO [Geothermobacter hydrogeniphilus]ORJ61239.1 tRNA (N6-threonylcarbamoyladenosine(37)-N6)-methyltransferase TrmO [Geothermobacter hydrogeniphilus]